ncbi:MAG: inner membrane protein [Patescibacteria group bacterium]|nr:inner membrane protein [Patescibacteria group bacterium]
MTGRTHDLAAFTAMVMTFVYIPEVPEMTLITAIVAMGANFIGGLFPDIDQPTSDFWDNFRLGPFVAKIICPAFGGHRNISHSFLGLLLIGWLSSVLLDFVLPLVLLDINGEIVWTAFMIGVVSHILTDMPTKAGVPLLWPYDFGFGIPPIKKLRMESGKFTEKWIVFPGLLIVNGYLLYTHQGKIIEFISSFL